MKQEHWLATIIGLLVFAYVLDYVVNPLTISLPTPYHFFIQDVLKIYPFTITSIAIKSIALFIAPLLFLSFTEFNKLLKGIVLLIISSLLQLYALQDVVSGAHTIPLEWSLSLSLSGMLLLIPTIIFILIGVIQKADKAITDSSTTKDF